MRVTSPVLRSGQSRGSTSKNMEENKQILKSPPGSKAPILLIMIGFAFVPYAVALQRARLWFILPGATRHLCIYYLRVQENWVMKGQLYRAASVKLP